MILRRLLRPAPEFAQDPDSGLFVPRQTIAHLGGPRIEMDGHFTIRAVSNRGVRVLADFDNLILNAGLDRLGTSGVASHVQLGTGSTAPAVSQTALTAYSVGTGNVTNTVSSYSAGPPVYHQCIRTWRFNAGTATGTFSEIGVGWALSGSLFSRALIVDGVGTPTTITVLSDESLDIDYRFRAYPSTSDVSGTLTLSGVGYTYTLRPSLISTVSGIWDANQLIGNGFNVGSTSIQVAYGASLALGAITAQLTGGTNFANQGSFNYGTYTPGAYSRAGATTTGLTAGNTGFGIKGLYMQFGSYGYYQVLFGSVIPKDSTKIMTHSQRITWARRP